MPEETKPNDNAEQPIENTEEVLKTSDEFPKESSVIRTLRQQIKDKDKKIEELSTQNDTFKTETAKVPEDISQKVAKLEFDQFITSKPNLVDKRDDIWNVKTVNPNMSYEDAAALVLGKSILSSTPAPDAPQSFSNGVNFTPSTDLASKSEEELATLAKKELENLLG